MRNVAYLSRVDVAFCGEHHRVVILVHDPTGQTTHDCRVDVVAERNFAREYVEVAVAHWAVDVLRFVNITRGKF